MHRFGRAVALGLVIAAGGCGPTVFLEFEDESSGGEEDSGAGRPMSTTATTTTTTSTTVLTTFGDTGTPPPPPTTVTVTATGPGPDPTATDTNGNCGAIGETCVDGPLECCSGSCSVIGPLGGVCSECDGDEDCRWGCTPAWPLEGIPAFCDDGSIGAGCETSAACLPGLVCEDIVDIPGILTSRTCGQCGSDFDCPPGLLCGVVSEIEDLGGFRICLPPGEVPPGETCDLGGSGDLQCSTGICAPAALMGIPVIGVCSECESDFDCGGSVCVLPQISIEGTSLSLSPGFCE